MINMIFLYKIHKKEFDIMKSINKNKGITLIALVVTIVVLLILAGTTIAMLTGDNGIISMAQKAKEEYDQASKDEQQGMERIFNEKYAKYNGKLHVEDGKLLNQYNEEIQLKRLSWNSSLKIF